MLNEISLQNPSNCQDLCGVKSLREKMHEWQHVVLTIIRLLQI